MSEHTQEIKENTFEGAELFADLFNSLTFDQKNDVKDEWAKRVGDYMTKNGYRFVFSKWYKQADNALFPKEKS